MHDRRSIRTARESGGTIRGIARTLGASRNAVRRAIAPDARLEYSRPSMAEEYTPAVSEMLADYPRITVNQVAELVEWPGSRRALSDLVAQLRPAALAREREDLAPPTLGRITTGRVRFGPMVVGSMNVGSIHANSPEVRLRPA